MTSWPFVYHQDPPSFFLLLSSSGVSSSSIRTSHSFGWIAKEEGKRKKMKRKKSLVLNVVGMKSKRYYYLRGGNTGFYNGCDYDSVLK